jgi:hypothetical protein
LWFEEKVAIAAFAADVVATAIFYDPILRPEANQAAAWVLANMTVIGLVVLSFLVIPFLFFFLRLAFEYFKIPRVFATVILGVAAYIHIVYGAWSWIWMFFS